MSNDAFLKATRRNYFLLLLYDNVLTKYPCKNRNTFPRIPEPLLLL